ncbi:MAG: HIRAN domain-containing protein, partial [Rhodocyclaceae bacterium]|nr:HIRAN domain-containing protein [Rhodocyclaceae bacterium]
STQRLAAAWFACHGLLGLLEASARWHRQRPGRDPQWDVPEGFRLPAIVGEFTAKGCRARELLSPQELAAEGEAMHHCVGGYWMQAVAGDRLFALTLADGERATAQYHPKFCEEVAQDMRYRLVQLRGPCNRQTSRAMQAWAARIEAELNAPDRRDARWAALQARERLDKARLDARHHARVLDPKTERQLAAVLGWLGAAPLGPEVILVERIAGFQYHDGPQVEAELAPGQPLDLVPEPDNPHDALAVRITWRGVKLGYVPRPKNAAIAAQLARGEGLRARILAVDRAAAPWARVEFAVEEALTKGVDEAIA